MKDDVKREIAALEVVDSVISDLRAYGFGLAKGDRLARAKADAAQHIEDRVKIETECTE